jgi:FkbM family methyltransferase
MSLKTRILNFFRLLLKFPFFEKIICKYTQGRKLNTFIAKLPANYYQYPINSIRNVNRNNIYFELDISDYMEWLIYFGIQVEPREKLFSLSNNANIVFDIGANIGETTLNFSKRINSNGMIHSFEPADNCYKKLEKNILLNKFINIKVNYFGLGDTEGKFYLESDVKNNKGANKVHLNSQKESNIEIKRLDNYVENEKIEKIDLIKIDVEGFEYNVLIGGELSIGKFRPVLFIELDDNNLKQQNSSAQKLILFLEKYYSRIVEAESENIINSKMDFSLCHFDIIASNN